MEFTSIAAIRTPTHQPPRHVSQLVGEFVVTNMPLARHRNTFSALSMTLIPYGPGGYGLAEPRILAELT